MVRGLERQGFAVEEACDGETALDAIAARPPAIVLLDVEMPGMSGLEVLAELRRRSRLPVIVLTARSDEKDRVEGLELGADDYVVKPFSVRELAARIRSVLRRSQDEPTPPTLDFGRLVVRVAEPKVLLDDSPVDLTRKEFDLLAHLASAPRRVFSREELLREVWASSAEWQDPTTVTEHVRRIRLKLQKHAEGPHWIVAVRGVGYRFEPANGC